MRTPGISSVPWYKMNRAGLLMNCRKIFSTAVLPEAAHETSKAVILARPRTPMIECNGLVVDSLHPALDISRNLNPPSHHMLHRNLLQKPKNTFLLQILHPATHRVYRRGRK